MGQDFTALLRYNGPTDEVLAAITRLEQGFVPAEVRQVSEALDWHNDCGKMGWYSNIDHDLLPRRPVLPTADAALYTPKNFYLTFGEDTLGVYHLLRWLVFLTEADLQPLMIDAVIALGRLFSVTEGVIIGDFSHAWRAFLDGRRFDEIMKIADEQDGGEVANIGEMYLEINENPDIALKDEYDPETGRIEQVEVPWPHDKVLPEGWMRDTTWDSKYYWRLPLKGSA